MLQDIKTFFKTHPRTILFNAVIICLCYLPMAFSENIGIDTEVLIGHEDLLLASWKGIGRQGLLLTKALFGLRPYNPYMAGALFLTVFFLLGTFTTFFCWTASGKDDRYPYGLFLVLFSACPIWMFQFYFALQRTEVVLGLLYALISVFGLCQFFFTKPQKTVWLFAGLVFGVWSFSSYQGCVPFYIGLCILYFLLDLIRTCQEKGWKEYTIMIFQLMGSFLAIYLINTVVTHLFFGQAAYLQDQIAWGNLPFSNILYTICLHLYRTLVCRKVEYTSVYPLTCLCATLILIDFLRKKEIQKPVRFLFFLALTGLMAIPFLLTVYMGNIPAPRSQFTLQLTTAFGCMFACGLWKMEDKNGQKWFRKSVLILSAATVWLNVGTIQRLQYTDDLRYQEDEYMIRRIYDDIRTTEGAEELPVIFIGRHFPHLSASTLRVDMYGISFLEWDYSPDMPAGATIRIAGLMNALGMEINGSTKFQEEAVQISKTMNGYPTPGYISVQDGFVVIKLSDVP